MINVALIGISGFARWHHRDLVELAKTGAIRLVAATVINQAEEIDRCNGLRKMGCELFTDYRDMLRAWKGRLDLCVIPTGIHLHTRMTLAALQAGSNVLVEKPVAATVEEVDAMMAAEANASRFVAVGYQHISTPEIAQMKRAVLDGLIGTVAAIKCKGLWPRSHGYYRRNDWAGRLRNGQDWILDAPFNNAFAHHLNLICFLAGKRFEEPAQPRTIRAELYRAREIESADTACLRIETIEGIPLLLWVTHSCEKRCKDDSGPELEIRGSEGSITWTPEAIVHRANNGESELWPVSDFDQIRDAMLSAVLSRASGKEAFFCDLRIARMQTVCGNAAFESSEIQTIPGVHLLEHGDTNDRFVEIRDIERICSEAFRQEKLWSEMAVPWARPGREIRIGAGQNGSQAATADSDGSVAGMIEFVSGDASSEAKTGYA